MKFVSSADFQKLSDHSNTGVKLASSEPILLQENRTFRFVFSDSGVDRDGDRLDADGWDLTDYLKNPVVLHAHDTQQTVGRASDLKIENGKLSGNITFAETDLAETICKLVKGDFLKAVSVGFKPLEYEYAKDQNRRGGIDFKKQLLLEVSVVAIPSNPRALIDARYAGIDMAPLVKWVNETESPEADLAVYKSLVNNETDEKSEIGDDFLMAMTKAMQQAHDELEKLNKMIASITKDDDGDHDEDDMAEGGDKSMHLSLAKAYTRASKLFHSKSVDCMDEAHKCYGAAHKSMEEPEGDSDVEDKDEPEGDDEVVDKQFDQIMARVRASVR